MQRVLVKQADGHPTVAFRLTPGEKHCDDIPNGTVLQMVGREGEWVKVVRGGTCGVIKARNAKLIVSRQVKPATVPTPTPAPVTPAPVVVAKPVVAAKQLAASTVCSFKFNGTPYTIDLSKVTMDLQLSAHDWIVANVPNSGLRRSCGEGRCGSCVCMLSYNDATTGSTAHRAFNSCIRPILSCNGMEITSSMGIGTQSKPNEIQSSLAAHDGSQCGFCSVGMVMHLYSRLTDANGAPLTTAELDKMIDSNYCRCTGYRPILDTYKSFASDYTGAPSPLTAPNSDVFNAVPLPKPAPMKFTPNPPKPAGVVKRVTGTADDAQWVQVTTEQELCSALQSVQSQGLTDVFLVAGHTSTPIYKRNPQVLVDIAQVAGLKHCEVAGNGVHVGAGTTLHDAVEFLKGVVEGQPGDKTVAYKKMAEHGILSPGSNIRHTGTIGGNVMMAYENQVKGTFPTDWPMMLLAASASVAVVDGLTGKTAVYEMEEFFKEASMQYKYVKSFFVPFSEPGDVFVSFRTGVRQRYTEAICAAAMKVNITGTKITPNSARIVYNAISTKPIRLPTIESTLNGVTVTDEPTFQSICTSLATILPPITTYQHSLCMSYFYKFYLNLQPSLPLSLRLAANPFIEKGITGGTQVFQPTPNKFPVGEPIPKIDGLKQSTGEAEYVQNISLPNGTVHGAPVLAKAVGNFALDASKVTVTGFKGIVVAKDAPNNGGLFADKTSTYVGAVLAVALADTPSAAVAAAAQVAVTYTNTTAPILTIDEAMKANSFHPNPPAPVVQGDVDKAFPTCAHVVTDTWNLSSQYHFHLETQSALAVPSTESGMVVHSATQMPVFVAQGVATVLGNVPISQVTVKNRRCGGGYGGKLANSIIPGQLAAVCAHSKNLPVSLVYEQQDNMKSLGLRTPCKLVSKVGFNADGTIVAVKLDAVIDAGITNGSGFSGKAYLGSFDNCYNVANWSATVRFAKTTLPSNTSMRAPGWLPGIYNAERVINTVSKALKMNPTDVRQKNFYKKGDTTPYQLKLNNWNLDQLWTKVQTSANYQSRLRNVQNFNAHNRWWKKGLALVPSKFAVGYSGSEAASAKQFDVNLHVFSDGSMSVMCGGTELGQGLTTKVTQTIAYHLGVPMSTVAIAEQDTSVLGTTGASDVTGGSIGSEQTCRAAKNACDAANAALDPVRKLMPGATWSELVAKAYQLGISMTFHTMDNGVPGPLDPSGHVYNTYGCCVLECTFDALTGQVDFDRADIVYDLGQSANPGVDIGQVEGAFIMGMGYAVTEKIEYTAAGDLRWGDYMLPTPWEIPTIMNVTLATSVANSVTVNGGKAVGEPPITCTYAAIEAVEQAVKACAEDNGTTFTPSVSVPYTLEDRQAGAGVSYKQFKLA